MSVKARELAVYDIHKSFPFGAGRLDTLAGITFAAGAGEFVSIVGPSGCGKSTLLEIVCGLIEADRGTITIDGVRPATLVGQVAYMPQNDLLFPWRRVIDNVALPLEIAGVDRGTARREAAALFRLFGLEGFENAYPAELSGGMRQRAALMRTFLTRKGIVALDEPFGALDAHTRRKMQQWLAGVSAELGATILLVTHDVEEALILSDRVVVLSPRPARVVREFPVPLPRPRSILDPAFVRLKGEILSCLDAEETLEREVVAHDRK